METVQEWGAFLWDAAKTLNQRTLYGDVSPTGNIQVCETQGVEAGEASLAIIPRDALRIVVLPGQFRAHRGARSW